jgi:hypothetical protein
MPQVVQWKFAAEDFLFIGNAHEEIIKASNQVDDIPSN